MDAEKGQRKGKDLEARRISEAMRDLLNVYRTRFEEEFRASGVTLAQLRLLKAVGSRGERSAASIARECQVTPQTLHTMLARAVREGWITRGTTERNQRFVTAALTATGEAVLQQGIALKQQTETEMWRGVPTKAVRQARKTLEAGLANLRTPEASPKDRETTEAGLPGPPLSQSERPHPRR